jgi:cell pole-organizing protein PopZ
MSGTSAPGTAPASDPSMEDILASIRRILSDDEPKPDEPHPVPAAPAPAASVAADQSPVEDEVLMLDASMLVKQEQAVTELPPPPAMEPIVPTLVAPEAAAAAASSVEALMRTLHTEQSMRVTSLGPTIEDIVRQEIRPLLKDWLDTNLPPLVERLVRIEIERVVGRVRT